MLVVRIAVTLRKGICVLNGQGYQAPFHSVWDVLYLEEGGGEMNVKSS